MPKSKAANLQNLPTEFEGLAIRGVCMPSVKCPYMVIRKMHKAVLTDTRVVKAKRVEGDDYAVINYAATEAAAHRTGKSKTYSGWPCLTFGYAVLPNPNYRPAA